MAEYLLRFFFDAGSGICLWAANDAARDRWSYPIESSDLPLSVETTREAGAIISWYDKSINWDYPPDPSPWNEAERIEFNAAAQSLLMKMRQELGANYELRDESDTLPTEQ